MKKFSLTWKNSKQPKRQRKYRSNALLHIRGDFLNVHSSKELRKQYNRRSLRLRTGDTVKILRGGFKNKTGKVEHVDLKRGKINISDMVVTKKDGTKSYIPFEPSNLMLMEIKTEDKERRKMLERKKVG